MPFQLASPEILPDTDTAEDAMTYELDLEPGDVIVMGTDGLFNNMWDEELAPLVASGLEVRSGTFVLGWYNCTTGFRLAFYENLHSMRISRSKDVVTCAVL